MTVFITRELSDPLSDNDKPAVFDMICAHGKRYEFVPERCALN